MSVSKVGEKVNDPLTGKVDWKGWLKQDEWPAAADGRVVRSVDLFSGCGGLTLGAWEASRRLGFKHQSIYAVDIMDAAGKIFTSNFPESRFDYGDISSKLDSPLGDAPSPSELEFKHQIGPIELLLAGPPCQGHSDLNNHTRRDDPRNDLYLRATRAIEVLRPEIALIENVQTVTRSKTQVVQKSISHLNSIGYSTVEFQLKASDLGLPQRRVRHFTIASLQVMAEDISQFSKTKEGTLSEAISDLLDSVDPDDVYNSPSTHQPQNVKRISWLFGLDWTNEERLSKYNVGSYENPEAYDLISSRRPKCHQNGHSYPAVYGRMRWDEAAPTITRGFGSTGQGRFVHPLQPRTLTPHEAARVQTFPDFFSFSSESRRSKIHSVIGNAVPPLMAAAILERLLGMLPSLE